MTGWEKKHSRSENHFWDTEIYSYVARDIFIMEECKKHGLKKVDVNSFMKQVETFLEETGEPYINFEDLEEE